MKWQDFGKIKKDKFAAAAESGRQPCGCLSPTARRAKWRSTERNGAETGIRGRVKCIFTRKKAVFKGGFVYKFTDIGILPLHK